VRERPRDKNDPRHRVIGITMSARMHVPGINAPKRNGRNSKTLVSAAAVMW
jgi:hypothetical protein